MKTEKLQDEFRNYGGPEEQELAEKLETKETAEACDRLVQNEVYFNMSTWFDYATKMIGVSQSDVHELHQLARDAVAVCPVDLEEIPFDKECPECEGTGNIGEDKACNECDDGRLMIEIYEWWAVSKYLGRKFAEHGEVVLEGEYWGRRTTGQGIAQDGIIETVVREQRAFVAKTSS